MLLNLFRIILLYPLSVLWGTISHLRNKLYDWTLLKTEKNSRIFTISVGNIAMGGTGKTPHIEYLISLINSNEIAVVSRGYKRHTRGIVDTQGLKNVSPQNIGDEPFQIYKKFRHKIKLLVAEKKTDALRKISDTYSHVKILLLDDAFQHRAIHRDLNILMTDFQKPFFKDVVFPSGMLREFRCAAKRADAIIVSKCPENISDEQKKLFSESVKFYSSAKVFFSKLQYENICFINGNYAQKNVELLTAIANPKSFFDFIKTKYHIENHYIFPDHYNFTEKDLQKIAQNMKSKTLICTEKDAIKLEQFNLSKIFKNKAVAYYPISILFDDKTFDEYILNHLKSVE